jgi:hypothetical protein
MSSSNPVMDVLYLNTYNHVLAIFTRDSEPAQLETDVSVFVGAGLHVFDNDAKSNKFLPGEVVVPSSLIGVFQLPLNPSQLLVPRTLCAAQGNKSTVLTQATGSIPMTSPASPPPIVVAVSPAVTASTSVLVLVNDPTQSAPIQVATQISAGLVSVSVPIPGLVSGTTYWAIVAVAGYPLRLLQVTG